MRGMREGGGENGGGEEKMPGQEAEHLPPVSSENKIFRRKSKNPHGRREMKRKRLTDVKRDSQKRAKLRPNI